MVFLFIISILFLLIITLKIRIEIKNVNFILKEPERNQENTEKSFNINDDYLIKIKFIILNFLPILKINLTKQKIDKISQKINLEKINSKFKNFRKNSLLVDTKKLIQSLKIDIKKIYLKANIGLESIMLLTYVIPLISTVLSIYLSNKKIKIKNQFYEIKPLYNLRKYGKHTIRRNF